MDIAQCTLWFYPLAIDSICQWSKANQSGNWNELACWLYSHSTLEMYSIHFLPYANSNQIHVISIEYKTIAVSCWFFLIALKIEFPN